MKIIKKKEKGVTCKMKELDITTDRYKNNSSIPKDEIIYKKKQ